MLTTSFDNREKVVDKFKEAFSDILENIDEIMQDDHNLTKTIEAVVDKMEVENFVEKLHSKGLSIVYVLEYDETVEIYEEDDAVKLYVDPTDPLDGDCKEYFKRRARIYDNEYDLSIYDIWR